LTGELRRFVSDVAQNLGKPEPAAVEELLVTLMRLRYALTPPKQKASAATSSLEIDGTPAARRVEATPQRAEGEAGGQPKALLRPRFPVTLTGLLVAIILL
jgi:hypothetical protein